MKKLIYASLIVMGGIACALMLRNHYVIPDASFSKADSLNHLSYDLRYIDLGTSAKLAVQAYSLSSENNYTELSYTSLNLMGFAAFMHMDFEHAIRLYRKVLQQSHNEVECLIANVGMMKVCQRTSMNKEFYDYRNKALQHIRRIKEDEFLIESEKERKRVNYAFSEFYIVSGIYFYYLEQQAEAWEAINSVTPEMIKHDKAQQLYYKYMKGSGGMYEADCYESVVIGELEYLIDCLEDSKNEGYVYFEANAMQAIAELLHFRKNQNILQQKRRGLLQLLNEEDMPLDSLPLYYAQQALQLFKRYGDWYQISGTYRTMATCYNSLNQPQKAMSCLQSALQYVNWHHEKFYHCKDSLDRLFPFVPQQSHSVELDWIENEGIKTVPEWILRLREQFSRTYSAMGKKTESDYNRNIYLDLLDYTRQDKALENRYDNLAKELQQLNILLVLVIMGFMLLLALVFLLNRYLKKRNRQYLNKLNLIFELCRKIISSVSVSPVSKEEIVSELENLVTADFRNIFGVNRLRFFIFDETDAGEDALQKVHDSVLKDQNLSYSCNLFLPGTHKLIGRMEYSLIYPMSKDKKELLKLILPYITWAIKNALNMLFLEEEKCQVEKMQYIHGQHLIESKRQNSTKKACFSIVTGMVPYIDRIINEVYKLKTAAYSLEPSCRAEKINYIRELLVQINEYNDILALWIKMRKGVLSLHVETFLLQDLFAVIEKSHRAFEMKGVTLNITLTSAQVKADKALTLFMINTLAENARKYTPTGGKVHLYAKEYSDYVEISVKDTGIGLSEEDIRLILNEKIYDAMTIGLSTGLNQEELKKQKGHGFGLMNCKGIIEQYRKTNPLFKVCSLGIDSELGKGSRFFFRLPKGIRSAVTCISIILFVCTNTACSFSPVSSPDYHTLPGDTLLSIANRFVNQVYECNVRGEHVSALSYADSVFHYMNLHFMTLSDDSTLRLCRYKASLEIPEVEWLRRNIPTDYYILLDVRNEVAVAGLALQDFKVYYYNNKAYSILYKLISKDKSLDLYCSQIQCSARNKEIALTLLVLVVIASIWGYYLFSIRPRMRWRYNMEQVFISNESISSFIHEYENSDNNFIDHLFEKLQYEIRELTPYSNLMLALYDEVAEQLIFKGDEQTVAELSYKVESVFMKPVFPCMEYKNWLLFPLHVDCQNKGIGVLAVEFPYASVTKEEKLLVGLIAGDLSIMLYQNVVQVKRKHSDIESVQDDTAKLIYEENQLHVQNMVLDNCLSTIKHETIYYPNRIKYLMDKVSHQDKVKETEFQVTLDQVEELIAYYKAIFTLLSSCAARQLDGVAFHRSTVHVRKLLEDVVKYFKKVTSRSSFALELNIKSAEELAVVGDDALLAFLLENLIDEAIRYPASGTLTLTAHSVETFVQFDFNDNRRNFTQEELNLMFYPQLAKIQLTGDNELAGTEYLLCKQIIREHDDYAGKRGCRIIALSSPNGFTIRFTVPLKNKR